MKRHRIDKKGTHPMHLLCVMTILSSSHVRVLHNLEDID